MLVKDVLYALDDITIISNVQTNSSILQNKDCNIYDKNGVLPIFTEPLDTIVCRENIQIWENNKIIPIMPKSVSFLERTNWYMKGYWIDISLEEFKQNFCNEFNITICNREDGGKIVIDAYNESIYLISALIEKAKQIALKNNYILNIMVKNVMHPEAFRILTEGKSKGPDYIVCVSSISNYNISNNISYYPLASLLDECKRIKDTYNLSCKIIAGSDIKNITDILKALSIGADYVMLDSLLVSCIESACPIISENQASNVETIKEHNKHLWDNIYSEENKKDIIKLFAPMKTLYHSSNTNIINVEDIGKTTDVIYTIHQWTTDFSITLQLLMLRCNVKALSELSSKIMCKLIANK